MAKKKNNSSANLGFEKKLWAAADKMRGNMDPSEYKHIVLGLIFLKYISDSFEQRRQEILKSKKSFKGEEEDKDAYLMKNVFWVPKKARWVYIQDNAKSSDIGKIIDEAMIEIEKDNPSLKGVLSKDYARPAIDKTMLGEIIDLIGTIGLGDKESKAKDVLGRVYEYFLGQFASAEGKGGGEFFTPRCIVKLLVHIIEPYKGRVFDPCCGSGGMFVQSENFIKEHGGKTNDLSIFGQESNPTTWRLCKMNLAIRGIEGNIGDHHADSFHEDLHKDLKADFILANPPFNDSDWGGDRLKDDVRWKYGTPPEGNANYAWIQHFIHHLAPTGMAGFVMANGALSSNTSNEGEIRKNMIKAGLVDCIVAMPDKLFYTTGIPATLWFVARDRSNHKFRDRKDEILFIDARDMGKMIDRRHRELTNKDIKRIADTYHNWRKPSFAKASEGKYKDIKGFCKSAGLKEVEKNDYVLTPGRYVGIEIEMEDDETFERKMKRLTKDLRDQFKESKKLEKEIKKNLKRVGFNI